MKRKRKEKWKEKNSNWFFYIWLVKNIFLSFKFFLKLNNISFLRFSSLYFPSNQTESKSKCMMEKLWEFFFFLINYKKTMVPNLETTPTCPEVYVSIYLHISLENVTLYQQFNCIRRYVLRWLYLRVEVTLSSPCSLHPWWKF